MTTAGSLPAGPRAALETILSSATGAVGVQRADLATALVGADPLILIVNSFASLIGIPGLSFSLDVTSGSTAEAAAAINDAITVLRTFRRTIPV
jgi:hypothetical protein